MDYQNYQPLENFRDLIDWQLEEANREEKEYTAKYYPSTIVKEYTFDDLVNPSTDADTLQRVGEAQIRWYKTHSTNKDGTHRFDDQDLFYTLVKYYIDHTMIHHIHIAGYTIPFCDRSWLSTYPTTIWCCEQETPDDVFIYGLYIFLFQSFEDDFKHKIKWDAKRLPYLRDTILYFTDSTTQADEITACKNGDPDGNFVLCRYIKSRFTGGEDPDLDWDIVYGAFEEFFLTKFGLREIDDIKIKDTRNYKK